MTFTIGFTKLTGINNFLHPQTSGVIILVHDINSRIWKKWKIMLTTYVHTGLSAVHLLI